MIDETDGRDRVADYNPVRGAEVIARGRAFLDRYFPLESGSHAEVTRYAADSAGLLVELDDRTVRLATPALFVGYQGEPDAPSVVVLVHHGLHVEIEIDRQHSIGAQDQAVSRTSHSSRRSRRSWISRIP